MEQSSNNHLPFVSSKLALLKEPLTIPLYTIHRGRHAEIPNATSILNQQVINDITAIAKAIDTLSKTNSTYRDIKDHTLFRRMYGLRSKTMEVAVNTWTEERTVDALPCHFCGTIFALEHISVDHTRPQQGLKMQGNCEAIAKVLRVFEMTEGYGKGQKSSMLTAAIKTAKEHKDGLQAGMFRFLVDNEGAALPISTVPIKHPATIPSVFTDATLDDRYTLNQDGQIFYSLVVAAGMEKALKERCMNSLVNLRPLCFKCNSGRGAPALF
ncbi:uncharacterized protein BDZ99DRAFT_457713 [Mytilinidion resinicola]|uniref:Uncharacterized protein n=1 Tax=Mytilinidion resinicola TaxID=574789 RepID=A0A6A6Z4J5_9PEZI|nr:uncharacterized protein BDZ99DRAFT_457713 [Mytilinidion resinicola]KAF2815748.1 hypothetical protein BDZ99DRAFT_457713 [Mytilinidion resinicola]